MSKENTKKERQLPCDACDFQKLKKLENNPVIRQLRDKIEQLSFRLNECKNQNQMLRRNLQLAKKMICQEIGSPEVNFQALLKYGSEPGSKDRQENILILKTKVQELKEYLNELDSGVKTPEETHSEEFVKHQMPSKDRKKLWRTELERRLAREDVEKDIKPLAQECTELRRNLEAEKNRYRELSEEVKLLKAELQTQIAKNEQDFGIVESFKTLETQLGETLAERAKIRQELDGSKVRNSRLAQEITSIKEEIQALQKKISDNNIVIDSLTSSHKKVQEAIDIEKAIVEQNAERYTEELKVLEENQATDFEILEHLQCVIQDRNVLIDELSADLEPKEVEKEPTVKQEKSLKDESKTQDSSEEKDEPTSTTEEKPPKESKTKPSREEKNEPTPTKGEKSPAKGSKVKTPIEKEKKQSKSDKEEKAKAPDASKAEASDDKTPEEDAAGDEEERKIKLDRFRKLQNLKLECAKYKALCEAAKLEGDRLSILIANQDKKMNEIALQVMETGRLITEKNAEKKVVFEKVNNLQNSMSARRKKSKFHTQTKSKQGELRVKCDAQREENDFLRNFLRSAVCHKSRDLQQLKVFMADHKNFFGTCMSEIQELVKIPPFPEQNDATSEINN